MTPTETRKRTRATSGDSRPACDSAGCVALAVDGDIRCPVHGAAAMDGNAEELAARRPTRARHRRDDPHALAWLPLHDHR